MNVETLVIYLLAAQIPSAADREKFLKETGVIGFNKDGVPFNLVEEAINAFMTAFRAAKAQAKAA